jgi:hypothetical protein
MKNDLSHRILMVNNIKRGRPNTAATNVNTDKGLTKLTN